MGAQELIIVTVVLLIAAIPLGLVIWAAVDVSRRADAAFDSVSGTKMLWLLLPIALTFVGVGWIVALVYLIAIRPKLSDTPSR